MVVLEAEPVVAPDYGGAPRGAAGVDSWPAFFGFAAFFTAGFGDWGGGLAGVGGLVGGLGGGAYAASWRSRGSRRMRGGR